MEFISSRDEILANLLLLDNYLRRHGQETNAWAIGRIQQGQALVAYNLDGRWLFGHSRFVGYIGNTRDKYIEAQKKGGGETSLQIEKALDCKSSPNGELEREYGRLCQQNGVTPSAHERTYWIMRTTP